MELNQCEIALADMLERYRFKGTIDVSDEDMSRWICGGCSDAFFHAIALLVAKKFHAAGTTYLEADHCINALNWFYLEHCDFAPVYPFWDVYLAFDAGEYFRTEDHSDDPVAEHTVPLIKAFLAMLH